MDDNSQKDSREIPVLDAVVQLGLIRMNVAIGTRADAYFPRMCLFVDENRGMILASELLEPAPDYLPAVAEQLNKLANRLGGVPRQIQLRDPRLARELRELLEPYPIEIVVRESLPKLDEAIETLKDFGVSRLGRNKPQPTLMDAPGMTLDHIIAFAEAAQAFYDAKPWRHLIDDDLIEIHSPAGPKGTHFTQVLGAGGHTFGLGFVETRQQHESMRDGAGLPRGRIWSMLFSNIDGLPFEDGELWERRNLPLADGDAYPSFGHYTKSKGFTHPTVEELAFAEGLLRAIAATTEDELDSGRWEKEVTTSLGPMTYKLSLPILLEEMSGTAKRNPHRMMANPRMQMESMMRALGQQLQSSGANSPAEINRIMEAAKGKKAPEFVPQNDAERAQALVYEAHEARGRRQLQLARQALAIDPDCADAILLLADRISDPAESIKLYERALRAAERKLGDSIFEDEVGHFWGILETRPYMRARQHLGMDLMNLEQWDEAAKHFRDMLRLNPGDNQGVRYALAQALLHAGHLDELDALLNHPDYRDDFSAEWKFTRLLLEFRRKGDSPETRRHLSEAMQSNRYLAPMLTGRLPAPPPPDSYSPGNLDEAAMCYPNLVDAWEESPGALEWLEKCTETAARRAEKWQREREKKKRRK